MTDLGLRQAGPDVRRAARRAPGDHREAAGRQPGPGRGDQRHRRGPRPAGDHRRRRDRHRRARSSRSSARSSARASRRSTPAPRTASCPTRRSTGSRASGLREVVLTDSIPLPPDEAPPEDQDPLRRAAHRRGDPADPPRRVGRRALLVGGVAHPGDAPVGGRRRARASTLDRASTATDAPDARADRRPATTPAPAGVAPASTRETDDPPAPPARRPGRPRAAAP